MRLIDADALMKFPIRIDHYDKENGNEHFVLGIESVLEYAEHLPTIEAEPVVHGRWKRYTDEKFMGYDSRGRIKYRKYYSYECTCCGENRLSRPNYCPNCGAKMDGG